MTYSALHNVWVHYVGDRIYPGLLMSMLEFMAEDWELSEWVEENEKESPSG